MISQEFEFHAPSELAPALAVLADRGSEVTVLAGGMSLLPMMNLGIATPEIVLSINHIQDLEYVTEDEGNVFLGACVRHVSVATDPLVAEHCPALAEAASLLGDVQVRNRGTIGGSVSHADPSADYLPVLALIGAGIRLRSHDGDRVLGADDFFLHVMSTARQPSELVSEIVLPKRKPGSGMAYKRFARVEGSFAIANAAAMVNAQGTVGRVALGGAAPTPIVLDVSDYIREGVTQDALAAVGQAAYDASIHASGDAVSDAEYRREMARVFARRALTEAATRAESGEPGSSLGE